jgi:hypothetical protein
MPQKINLLAAKTESTQQMQSPKHVDNANSSHIEQDGPYWQQRPDE